MTILALLNTQPTGPLGITSQLELLNLQTDGATVRETRRHRPMADAKFQPAHSGTLRIGTLGIAAHWGMPGGIVSAKVNPDGTLGSVKRIPDVHDVDALLPGSSGGACAQVRSGEKSTIRKLTESGSHELPVLPPESVRNFHRVLSLGEGFGEVCVCSHGFCVKENGQFHLVNTWQKFVADNRVGNVHDALAVPGMTEYNEILLATDTCVLSASIGHDWTVIPGSPGNVRRLWLLGGAQGVLAACRVGSAGQHTSELWRYSPRFQGDSWQRIVHLPFEVLAATSGGFREVIVGGRWPQPREELPVALVKLGD